MAYIGFRQHLGLKFVSIALAALLWIAVSGEQTVERSLRIPLEFTNLPAQLFFRRQEFKATRVLRGYYEDSGEDAFVMEYRFANAPDEVEESVNRIAQYEEN